jgi:hypothetical protein
MSAERRVAEMIAAAQLADEVGLDVFGIGEHHRPDFAVRSPAVILGAVASTTSSAVPSAKWFVGSLLEIERAARRARRRGPGISKAREKTGGRPRTDIAKLKNAKVSV